MITVLFFASLREQLDLGSISIDLSAPTTLSEVIQLLAEQIDGWYDATNNQPLLYAVNQEMVTLDAQVCPGDEVAIFPPVTGG